MNLKDIGLLRGAIRESKKGLDYLAPVLKEFFVGYNIPFIDVCCPAPLNLPVSYNEIEDKLKYFDPDTQIWVNVPLAPSFTIVEGDNIEIDYTNSNAPIISAIIPPQVTDVFTSDITVSLSGGKTFGKYINGQIIPATGLTAKEVILLAAIEDIAPVYTPAALLFSRSAAIYNEIGTPYVGNNLIATFNQNDAGALTAIRIQKNGADIVPNGVTSPFNKTDSGTYISSPITFQAFANYNAGVVKNYSPSNTPDARLPLVRNANAPQAAENNFSSSILIMQGFYKFFYGATATIPTDSATVRALPTNQLSNAGNVFILNTGTTLLNFAISIPVGNNLVSVIDLDAGNFNIIGTFTLSNFNVNDAGGTPVTYKNYVLTIASPYPVNHRFQITIS